MSDELDNAEWSLKQGERVPYDYDKKFCAGCPQPAKDCAHLAARGILANMTDRKGIANGFENIDYDVIVEITESIANIIRLAMLKRDENAG